MGLSVVVRYVGSLVSFVDPGFFGCQFVPCAAAASDSLVGLVHEAAGCGTPRGLSLCWGPDGWS